MKTIICDIDMTLANYTPEMRGHHDYDRVAEDHPHAPIIELIQNHIARKVWRACNGDGCNEYIDTDEDLYEIVFVTGRPERCRSLTLRWLTMYLMPGYLLWNGNKPYPGRLYMRTDGDHRPSDDVKRENYKLNIEGEEVLFVLEDRRCDVKMWRELGLTVLDVADGDY